MHVRLPLIVAITALYVGCAAPPPPSRPSAEPPAIVASAVAPRASEAPPPAASVASIASGRSPKEPESPCAPGTRVDVARLKDAIVGHFSAPDAEERAGELPCNVDDTLPGRALLRRKGDVWVVARFAARENYRVMHVGCRALPIRGGRELVVCEKASPNSNVVSRWIDAIDYARPAGDDTTTLLTIGDDTARACEEVPAGADVLSAAIDAIEVRDLDGDGASDLRVSVRAGKVRIPSCPAGGGAPKLRDPPARTIDFIARGAALAATPKSAVILAEIAANQR